MTNVDDGNGETSFAELMNLAHAGDRVAIGELLQRHRNYLLSIVNQEVGDQLRGKVGSSDIVQESLLTATQKFDQFKGDTKKELLAWLRRIALHDVGHEVRKFTGTQMRQVGRERPLQLSSSLDVPLVDPQMTPQTNALNVEDAERLRTAMSKLSDEYQLVLDLHDWQKKDFHEIGEIMQRSHDAARKLYQRAFWKLSKSF